MKTYREFRPTSFDRFGLALAEKQDWLVAPVGRNRDSDLLEESNFAMGLERLGGESDTVEVHRFGHWACGWFEIILINPADTDRVAVGNGMELALSSYPILDEMDFSRRELEATNDNTSVDEDPEPDACSYCKSIPCKRRPDCDEDAP